MDEREELSAVCGRLLQEMLRFNYHAGERDQGAIAVVLDKKKWIVERSGPRNGK